MQHKPKTANVQDVFVHCSIRIAAGDAGAEFRKPEQVRAPRRPLDWRHEDQD
jgi:hypothetical protein